MTDTSYYRDDESLSNRKDSAMLLTDLRSDTFDYPEQHFYQAMESTADELRAGILSVITVMKGDKTVVKMMRKEQLAVIAARIITQKLTERAPKGPRPRKSVMTRAERKALGTRKHRRDCMSARKHRAMVGNKHHKIGGR